MTSQKMDNVLQHQFSGFLNTPQVWKYVSPLPYSVYQVRSALHLRNLPDLQLSPTLVLGKRMESFFHYYVTAFTNEKVLARNEQIIHDKTTLGELDFLLHHPETNTFSHVELVYKFYLYDPQVTEIQDRWIGPNRRDSLSRKISRLRNNQLPLLYREETFPLLDRLGIPLDRVKQKICFKANLFLPWEYKPEDGVGIFPETAQGFWIKAKDFHPSHFGKGAFFSPKKPDWPILPENNTTWVSFEQIREQIVPLLEKERSPLVWMKTDDDQYYRFFVVWW